MRGLLSILGLLCLGGGQLGEGLAYGQTAQVVAWGANDCEQGSVPPPNADFIAVAGGNAHSLGLKSDSAIVAWGHNECGQCDVPLPNQGFAAIAAGGNHSLGLKSDGTIVAWGCNDNGECDVPLPNADFVAIAAGDSHSLGLKSDGTIVAWGYNDFGQCNVPVPNADFDALGAGWYHSLGLKSDGTIVGWGYNGDGQCDVPSPNASFVAIAGGGAHSLGLKSDGTIVAWGDNASGQCNVPLPNLGFAALSAGNAHSLGLKSDGTIVAWGANEFGQCDVPSPNADFVMVSGGAVHSMGVTSRTRLYVDQAATGAQNGTSWVDAYTDLQSAMIPAGSGTSIWVAAGTYKPAAGGDRTAAFVLKTGVGLYGGFGGTETLLDERDASMNPTILSGDIGVGADSTDNSYHVVVGSGCDSTAVLDGFVITAGRGEGGFPDNAGGGMYNEAGSPTVGNVTFSRNSSGLGGAVYNGGASEPVLANVAFSQNHADSGGGMFNSGGASPTLTNVRFWGNVAENGGGMSNAQGCHPMLTNVTFSGNIAGSFGGAIYNAASVPVLFNAVLWGDSAGTGCDEICNTLGSSPYIANSLIQGCGGSGASWDGSQGSDGGNNKDADPLFVSPATGNLWLNRRSPAVNGGYNLAANLLPTDLDGNPRIVWDIVDMGAYEYQGALGPVIYVSQGAVGSDNGSSWTDAYRDLQSALGAAEPGDSIWVAAGTYKPTAGGDRTAAFVLKTGVGLYGGFAGTEATIHERNWKVNKAILSGDIGVENDDTDNSHHVTIASGTDSTTVIDGFTITAGKTDDETLGGGGGMTIWPGSPTIRNTIFKGNSARIGGGLYSRGDGSRPALANVVFSENAAGELGGGLMNVDHSHPKLVNVVFSGNSSGGSGGGMLNQYSAGASLTNVTFLGNTAAAGGAICNDDSSGATLINTILWGDSAASGSEIWNNAGSTAAISYSLVKGCGGSGAGWDASFGTDGGSNIDSDPMFVDLFGGNLRLTTGSPAMEAGTNAAPDLPARDLDDNPRISGFTVDMGAYETHVVTGIESDVRPEPFRIASVFPNPFNPSTTIQFTLPGTMTVTAEVWSVTGALVRVLASNKPSSAGENQLLWDGRNDHGSPVASGVYFVRIETRSGTKTARAVLLK